MLKTSKKKICKGIFYLLHRGFYFYIYHTTTHQHLGLGCPILIDFHYNEATKILKSQFAADTGKLHKTLWACLCSIIALSFVLCYFWYETKSQLNQFCKFYHKIQKINDVLALFTVTWQNAVVASVTVRFHWHERSGACVFNLFLWKLSLNACAVHYGIESGAEKPFRASKSLGIPRLYANIERKTPDDNQSPWKEED